MLGSWHCNGMHGMPCKKEAERKSRKSKKLKTRVILSSWHSQINLASISEIALNFLLSLQNVTFLSPASTSLHLYIYIYIQEISGGSWIKQEPKLFSFGSECRALWWISLLSVFMVARMSEKRKKSTFFTCYFLGSFAAAAAAANLIYSHLWYYSILALTVITKFYLGRLQFYLR